MLSFIDLASYFSFLIGGHTNFRLNQTDVVPSFFLGMRLTNIFSSLGFLNI